MTPHMGLPGDDGAVHSGDGVLEALLLDAQQGGGSGTSTTHSGCREGHQNHRATDGIRGEPKPQEELLDGAGQGWHR